MQILTKISVTLKKSLSKQFPKYKDKKGKTGDPLKIYNVLAVDRQIVKINPAEIDVKLTKGEKLFTDSDDKEMMVKKKIKQVTGKQQTIIWFLIASNIDGSFKWIDSTKCRYHNSEGSTTVFEEE